MGFDIVLRPGPYIYAEWKNNGVPDRVAHLHRLDPLFLTESSKYMQAVVEVIQPYFIPAAERLSCSRQTMKSISGRLCSLKRSA